MRKFCYLLLGVFLCIDGVSAAVRTQNTATPSVSRQSTSARAKTETTKSRSVSSRAATISNNTRTTTSRAASNKIITGRSATKKSVTRGATRQPSYMARAAATVQTRTFGESYNSCRDAYFSCMDQFCATQNESYRRCVCSSKLKEIQSGEKKISQTEESLKDFQDLNIEMIPKSAQEVHAMLSAAEGETAIKKDNSKGSNLLKNISSVLSESKSKSLSTQGKLDIAGDIKSIWNTTNLIGGSDIANLTGESLYNAVHAQCSELVADSCAATDMKMITSAYGMYIENDCSILETNLRGKTTTANASIRDTRHKMQDARLENYDAHNSVNINDCIANVRADITADTACGTGYIHCLDYSGKYLNISTGAPIYSPEFYQIENQISLSGDVLKNNQNSAFVNVLNKKRSFAAQSLDLCRDNADEVWDEFLRQALVEIYQGQQERVKAVKEECLSVVNQCYLKQSKQLQDFSDTDTKINLGQTLELSEEMCADKLNTCSNLYGGGDQGMEILIATMTGITDQTIEQSCTDLLNTFAKNLCAVTGDDSEHSYPYGCRAYAPGEARYASNSICNNQVVNPFAQSKIYITRSTDFDVYAASCSAFKKIYTSCKPGYYLSTGADNCSKEDYTADNCYTPKNAPKCAECPSEYICAGGTTEPHAITTTTNNIYKECGEIYIGSLYHQMARYAMQNCTRPSSKTQFNDSYELSASLLAQINVVMSDIRAKLATELSNECINQGKTWVDIEWKDEDGDGTHDKTGDSLYNNFYLKTGANTAWGYCKY